MVKQPLSLSDKHVNIIIFSLCVFVIISVFLLAYAINDPNIYTSIGGV
nr:hypothetical protein [Methanobrevibacter arboriphilus]